MNATQDSSEAIDGALKSGIQWDDLGELKKDARSAGWNKSKWSRALESEASKSVATPVTVTSTQTTLSVFISEHHVGSEGFQSTVETASQLLIHAAEREPHKACELRLRGVFRPTAKVVINWPDHLQQQLVVAGPGATISGEALPQASSRMHLLSSPHCSFAGYQHTHRLQQCLSAGYSFPSEQGHRSDGGWELPVPV